MIKFINRLFAPITALLGRFYTLNEVFRLSFMVGMIALLFSPDYGALQTMMYVMGVFLAIALIAHVTRKYCLFNYIDMKELYEQAKDHRNTAAAMVFCAVAVVICTCIVVAAQFFVRG
jgi:hypothetical protein